MKTIEDDRLNVGDVKAQSRHLVFKALAEETSTTRLELTRLTGLSLGTVKNVMDELTTLGIVEEQKDFSAAVGRKPHLFRLKAGERTILVIDISKRFFNAQVLDLNLSLLETLEQRSGEDFTASVLDFIDKAAAMPAIGGAQKLLGVSLVVPGPWDHETDRVICSIIPEFFALPLMAHCRRRFTVGVLIGMDARLAANVETYSDPEIQPMFYVHCDDGIGGTFLERGKVLRGIADFAGEIGQMDMGDGKKLEGLVGWQAFAKTFGIDFQADRCAAAAAVGEKLRSGNPAVRQEIEKFVAIFALALSHVACVLNPRSIVIGGFWKELGPEFFDILKQKVNTQLIERLRTGLTIKPAQSGDSGASRGGALEVLAWWIDHSYGTPVEKQ